MSWVRAVSSAVPRGAGTRQDPMLGQLAASLADPGDTWSALLREIVSSRTTDER
jgi:hypothetical protein